MPAHSWADLVIAGFGVVTAGLTAWAAWTARHRPATGGQAGQGGPDALSGTGGGTHIQGSERGTDRPVRREPGDERR
ncbi:hypothetical protein [Actinomadura sp. 6N118]|uniref:hypothetical protein n=1 Tax=Actinomadura sp. 6N118 TaxID=3375151 RepID=UPI0037A8EE63